MKHRSTFVIGILVVLALGAILVPAALAKGGATVHTYAPPPLDAGSALPNPDYVRISPYKRVSRGAIYRPTRHVVAASASTSDGFDWTDAGIGAGGAFVALLAFAPLLLVRQAGRKSLART